MLFVSVNLGQSRSVRSLVQNAVALQVLDLLSISTDMAAA